MKIPSRCKVFPRNYQFNFLIERIKFSDKTYSKKNKIEKEIT